MSFSSDDTKVGHLSPWEICKAFALHTALLAIEKKLKKSAHDLLGQRMNTWIAGQLELKGGGSPTEKAVTDAVTDAVADAVNQFALRRQESLVRNRDQETLVRKR